MTSEQTEKLRIARLAAKISLQVAGEDPETALAIVMTALQLVGKSCGLAREDVIALAREAIEIEVPAVAQAEGRMWS